MPVLWNEVSIAREVSMHSGWSSQGRRSCSVVTVSARLAESFNARFDRTRVAAYCASYSFTFRQLPEHTISEVVSLSSTPTKCIRFHTLRGFNDSHSKRRCQDREQNAAWYVACGTPFLRQAESCYQTLGSVLRMSSCSSGGTLANPAPRTSALGKEQV